MNLGDMFKDLVGDRLKGREDSDRDRQRDYRDDERSSRYRADDDDDDDHRQRKHHDDDDDD